mgnify:CR=1 FL=1
MDTVKDVTVYPTPFVKPHCVLIVADATVLLINRRLAHTDVRLQKHAGMFSASRTSVWLNCYNKKCEEHKNGGKDNGENRGIGQEQGLCVSRF